MNKIDVIIPVVNEAKNLSELVRRISNSLTQSKIEFSIIIIDDFSTDNTFLLVQKLSKKYPINYYLKIGKVGKAYSILQGARNSTARYLVMCDGDLQYPPEAIPQMFQKAEKENLSVVIGNRVKHGEGFIRHVVSRVGHIIYGRLLLGMNYDTQSGLKLFKRTLINQINPKTLKPWAFDLPLLYTAGEMGESIGSVDIDFRHRKNGKSKINFLKSSWEILTTAIGLKFKGRKVFKLLPEFDNSMIGAGFIYKKKKFVTHTTLHHSKSALVTFTFLQKLVILAMFLTLFTGLFINSYDTEVIFIAILSVVYFADVFFGLYLILKSLHNPPEIHYDISRLKKIKDGELPVYTILSPLYKEAHVLPQFVKNISGLDYPKDKLDVILLLEEDDHETIKEAHDMNLPSYFRILVVPDGYPKTKPKACNYGLAHAKGEYVVIYDAEDAPEPEQLKKAFLAFQNVGEKVFCLQAKLNYYNPNQNLLTKLFTAEYSLWFDIVLPGLQTIQTSIPLGGTSNHFRTADLKKLKGWDPFNVAEDADLGARLFRKGYKTAIIDSITLEEANSSIKNWIRQRSRWIKGYLQTYFVQMRHPVAFAKEQKLHYLIFQMVSGLRVSFMIINPFLWAMTLAYFLLYKFVGPQIEALYPTPVFYMAVFSAVFGNFLYLYYYMIGAAKREEWGIIKFVFLVPFYWLLTSIGAFMAFYQLIFKPHFWEKTVHGLNKNLESKESLPARNFIKFKLRGLGIRSIPNVKRYLSYNYFAGAFLIASNLIGNILNFLYNAYLSRNLSLEDFGLIGLVSGFIYLTQVPFSALSNTVSHKSAFLLGMDKKPAVNFWIRTRSKSVLISSVFAITWLLFIPIMMRVFKSESAIPFLIFVPIWVVGTASSVDIGFINGNLIFISTGLVIILESIIKLSSAFILVNSGFNSWVYSAVPISITSAFLLGWFFAVKIKNKNQNNIEGTSTKFPIKFFTSTFVYKLSGIVFLSLDVILAKIFLSPTEAGLYALLSLAGKMIFLFGSQFTSFIIPLISKNEGSGNESGTDFNKLFTATTISTFVAYLGLGILGNISTPLLFGPKILPVVAFLPVYGLAIAFQTISTCITLYHQSKNQHIFSYVNLGFSLLQIFGFIFLHSRISEFVVVVFMGASGLLLVNLLIHKYYEFTITLGRNILDLLGLFTPREFITPKESKTKLNILVFNWRDTKHVWSGGAEVYIHELSKRWVVMGHNVTVFCGNDGQNPRNEVIDGVQIIRRGGFYTVFIWAFLYYIVKFRGRYDEIIDSENGIPFFTPLYARRKIFLLIHHVHQEVFRIKLKPPLSWIGKFAERYLVPIIYRNTEVITVSPSSKADILANKLTKKDPSVIYNGVDLNVYKPGVKSARPNVLYLGRLTKQKSLSVLIRSAKKIIKTVPNVEFTIAGDGADKRRLLKITKSLKLQNKIRFTGKVSELEKVKLYQKAWVFVNPSLMEGWGITTIEANACGTPVVASNVAGLRDAVHNPHSGLLVPYGSIDEFANSISMLLKDGKVREKMSQEAIEWAKKYSWDKSAVETINLF